MKKLCLVTCLIGLQTLQAAAAQEPFQIRPSPSAQPVTLSLGQSSLLTFEDAIDRVSINDDAVAEVVVVSPRELLIHGKQVGSTSMIVWRSDGSHLFTVQVHTDSYKRGAFEKFLRTIVPEETGLWAYEGSGTIILAGKANEPANLSRVVDIASAFAGKVVNVVDSPYYKKSHFNKLLHDIMPGEEDLRAYEADKAIVIAGKAKHPASLNKATETAAAVADHVVNVADVDDPKQVLIEVRIAEVERTLARSLGLDYFAQSSRVTQAGFVGGSLAPQTPSTPHFTRINPSDILLSPGVKQLLELRGSTFDLSIAINALEQEGLVRILAEPNLLAMSGEEASFLAGGEFPIPVVQGNGAVSVEFKEFGIRLKFKPEVTSADRIRMSVSPEVSVLDSGVSSVTIGGFKVPGLITRRASTTVEMGSGESLVIGGLLSQTNTRSDDQVPFLGNIPILGKLFSSEKFKNEETELLVLVTPRLVKPGVGDVPQRFTDLKEAIEKKP